MESVKVNRQTLRERVQANRDKHQSLYKEAFEGFRHACIAALESNLAAFQKGSARRIYISETPPEDHTADYDVVLQMLEMSTEETVSLSDDACRKYVLDKWDWKRNWAMSNAKYLSNSTDE